jgi:hypothetical protein
MSLLALPLLQLAWLLPLPQHCIHPQRAEAVLGFSTDESGAVVSSCWWAGVLCME